MTPSEGNQISDCPLPRLMWERTPGLLREKGKAKADLTHKMLTIISPPKHFTNTAMLAFSRNSKSQHSLFSTCREIHLYKKNTARASKLNSAYPRKARQTWGQTSAVSLLLSTPLRADFCKALGERH